MKARASAQGRERRGGRDRCGAAKKSALQSRRKSIVSVSPRPIRSEARSERGAPTTDVELSNHPYNVAVTATSSHQYILPPISTIDPMVLSTESLDFESATPVNDLDHPCASADEPMIGSKAGCLDISDVSNFLDAPSDSDDFGGTLTAVNSGPYHTAIAKPDMYGWDAEWDNRQSTGDGGPCDIGPGSASDTPGIVRSKSRRTALIHRVLGAGPLRFPSPGAPK
jgi:hypothetical protein